MLTFVKEFWLGVQSYWLAISFIKQHRLYWYFTIPAVLMLLIYFAGNQLMSITVEPNFANMNGIVWYFIFVGVNISVSLLLMKFAKYLVVIILSPLLSHLSQRCDHILTGSSSSINFKQLVEDVKRGVRLAIRNILWEYCIFFVIYILAFIFWKDASQSPLFIISFVVGFYYYGFSFLDYDNERRKLNVMQSIYYVRKHRGLAMGIGFIYSILIVVPVNLQILFGIGDLPKFNWQYISSFSFHFLMWIAASVAPIFAIVSASIAMSEIKKVEAN